MPDCVPKGTNCSKVDRRSGWVERGPSGDPSAPFLRWPGGKRWLSAQLSGFFRNIYDDRSKYIEPFLGGGAVFFALSPRRAILSDINDDLVNAYAQIRDNPELIVKRLSEIPSDRQIFDQMRSSTPIEPVEAAIRFLYLNRHSFAGLYRINQRGEFNVPYGGDRTHNILFASDILYLASNAMKNIKIIGTDFQNIIGRSRINDIIYCDPAYTVKHNNNCFLRYNESLFSWRDQQRLFDSVQKAYRRGSIVLVSNADHKSIRELYGDYPQFKLERQSRLSPDSSQRKQTTELLIYLGPDRFQSKLKKVLHPLLSTIR